MKTTIVIPTYNEKENIGLLIHQILSLQVPGHSLHALVVDDNSPDGTSTAVKQISQNDTRVKLLTRTKKRGRGFAGLDGFLHAIADGADYVIEMDADFSHDPRYLTHLIKALDEGADLAIGSRFIPGGKDSDRGLIRKIISVFAGMYIRFILKCAVKDPTSGYRAFKKVALETVDLENCISSGPSILLELLYKCMAQNFRIVEIPIVFVDRKQGVTKLNWVTLLDTFVMVLRLRDLKKRGLLFST